MEKWFCCHLVHFGGNLQEATRSGGFHKGIKLEMPRVVQRLPEYIAFHWEIQYRSKT